MDAAPIRDANGAIIGAINCWRDISERKRTEDRLSESERRFAAIFEQSPIPMGIVRLSDNRYMDINMALLDLYGYSREEMVGHTAEEVGVWVDWQERQRFIEELQAHQNV